jgi:hypothetical protein
MVTIGYVGKDRCIARRLLVLDAIVVGIEVLRQESFAKVLTFSA